MTFKELYFAGMNFEAFMGTGIKSERDRIPKNYSRIPITNEEIEKIQNIDKKIYFLVAGEPWCMDFQLNATVLKKICELNSNFDMAIITKGRGEKFLKPLLEMEVFKVPTILALDENFNPLPKIFVERPEVVKQFVYEDVKIDYLKGKYLGDTLREIIDMIS